MALRDEVIADNPSVYLELNELSGLVSPDSSGKNRHADRLDGGPLYLPPSASIGGGALSRRTYTQHAIQIPEWVWVQMQDNWTFMIWVAPNENITIKAEANTGNTGGAGDQRYVAVHPTGIGAGSACLSVGRNAIQVFEHGASHLPCLLSYAPATPFAMMRFIPVHVVCVNKQIRLYVNGLHVKTGQTSQRLWIHPPFQIISDPWSPGFSGGVDEAAWWPRVLSDAEILSHSDAVPVPRPRAQLEANVLYAHQIPALRAKQKQPDAVKSGLFQHPRNVAPLTRVKFRGSLAEMGPMPLAATEPDPVSPPPPPTWWPVTPDETRVPVAP